MRVTGGRSIAARVSLLLEGVLVLAELFRAGADLQDEQALTI